MNNALQDKRMKYCFLCLAAITALFFVMSSSSSADVTRSCTATYGVSISSISGATNPTYPSFTGRGTVGYLNPNLARERARHNLDECITAHWENRDMMSRPSQCTETNQIYNYPFTGGLIPKIREDVCSRYKAYETLTIGLSVMFQGDAGCLLDRNLWSRNVASNYRISCPDYEYEPGADRLGGDYRSITLERADWHLCQTECNNDGRCQAWTYAKPGFKDPTRAKCYLKDSIPDKRPASCCDSGVKIIFH
jgi:hypothetical protein